MLVFTGKNHGKNVKYLNYPARYGLSKYYINVYNTTYIIFLINNCKKGTKKIAGFFFFPSW